MKTLNDYRIAFVGLKNGIHYFNYEIGETFFEAFEDSPVKDGQLFVDVALDKSERVFTLTFDIGGQVKTDCDRCAEVIDMPVTGHYKVFVRSAARDLGKLEEEEDVIIISPDASHLDLQPHIYDFILLSLPLIKSCEGGPYENQFCNKEILKKWQEATAPTEDETEEAIDPRWEKLKSIKKK